MKFFLQHNKKTVQVFEGTWEELQNVASLSFPDLPPTTKLELTWCDDEGDEIRVNNQQGVDEAIRWAAMNSISSLHFSVDSSSNNNSNNDDETSSVGSDWLDVGGSSSPTFHVVSPQTTPSPIPPPPPPPPMWEEEPATPKIPPPQTILATSPPPPPPLDLGESSSPPATATRENMEDLPPIEIKPFARSQLKSQSNEHNLSSFPRSTIQNEMYPINVGKSNLNSADVFFTEESDDEEEEEEEVIPPSIETDSLEVTALVEKIVSPPQDTTTNSSVEISSILLRMGADEEVLKYFATLLADSKSRRTISQIFAAELAKEGGGAKTAKVRVLTEFSKNCVDLIRIFPDFEPLLLSFLLQTSSPTTKSHASNGNNAVQHTLIVCDGCDEDKEAEKISIARGFRNASAKNIVGYRFKSAVVPNFDLCSSCEESMKFQATHGPFLKLTRVGECPELLLCAPRLIDGLSLETNLDTSGNAKLSKELEDFLAWRKQKEAPATTPRQPPPRVQPPPPPPPPESNFAPLPPMASLAPPPAVTFAKKQCNHTLKPFETYSLDFKCDKCRLFVPLKSPMYGCRTCNFDVCKHCYNSSSTTTTTTTTTSAAAAVVVATPPALMQAPLVAKFICDVTLSDNCVVRPGEKLEKIWRIRNTGETEWPFGTRMMHVGGDLLGGPKYGVELPHVVKPGEFINVKVDLVMPITPGRYTSYWRLTSPHPINARFGNRLWVTVNCVAPNRFTTAPSRRSTVDARPIPPPPPPLPQPTTARFQDDFSLSVAQIVDFGFNNVELITKILEEENGDTGRTIDRLLAMQ